MPRHHHEPPPPPPHHHGPSHHHHWGNGLLNDDDLKLLEIALGDADTAAAVHRALFYAPPEIGALGKLLVRALKNSNGKSGPVSKGSE
jgi:hypothetical protein